MNRSKALLELARLLGPDRVLTNPVELLTYERDASLEQGKPDAVVLPRSTAEVVRLVQWANEAGVPLIARGAGTGLSGGAVAEHGGVIVGFARMNKLLEFDEAGRSIVAEPGLVNLVLDELAKSKGLYFPPDPASGRAATLGGNIAENAGGPHCFKYGVTTNYIIGLEVVLADGQVAHFGGRALDYPEYDLVGLLTGSEGTLGLITQANARLLRNTLAVKTMMAAFDSVEAAGRAVSAVIAQGLVPATMEMMDRKIMRIIEDFVHAGLPVEAGAALIIEADGYPDSVTPQIEEIAAILAAHEARSMRIARSAEERDLIWYGRKSAAGAMARLAPAYYLVDGTVPRSRLAETLAAVNQLCEAEGLQVGYVFHAGDGNLHPFILIPDPNDKALLDRVMRVGQAFMQLCADQGGSITGEHGVGSEKRQFMPLMYNADELAAMREIKEVFDPRNLLNPGKIFPNQRSSEAANPTGRLRAQRANGGAAGLEDRQRGFSRLGGSSERPAEALGPEHAHSTQYAVRSTPDAADFIRACVADHRPIRVRGGGTKSAGLPALPALLSTAELRGITTCSLDDLYVTVGAGTTLQELQAELGRDKMWVPLLSPWSDATVGGIAATAFNAPLRMRYGAVRDLVLAATVVLPDGRIIRAGRPVVKNVAGYDLPKLFVGAHGTLGLITDVTFKLAPLPRARASLLVPVETLAQGMTWAAQLLRICLVASALVLCKGCDIPGLAAPYALVYTAEGMPEDVAAELAQVRAALGNAPLERDALSGSEVWAQFLAAAGNDETLRVGVAAKDLPRLLVESAPALETGTFVADVANGLLFTRGVPATAVRGAALAAGGYAVALSGPTPDRWGYVPEGLGLMRQLKSRWDPEGLFNPAAFVV
ncbi:MAG: FAD-binding oxidoreductase [Anaerolineae bacterium]